MQDNKALFKKAKTVLKENDRGSHTVPADGLYPHQWFWDSCFIAIGLRHLDITRAQTELRNLVRGQWHNGMLPHMLLDPTIRDRLSKDTWRSWTNPFAPSDIPTSGITQPPMLAEAVVRIGEKLAWPERRAWYKQMWPNLLALHEWLYHERDPHKEGLTLQVHPWETGLDNTPPWMAEMNDHLLPLWIRLVERFNLDRFITPFRRDTHRIPEAQRTTTIEELALYSTQRRLRRKAYDINRILDHALFAIEDLSFNCILIRANSHLTHIAESIKADIPENLHHAMSLTEKALEELWDPYSNQYYSRDFATHRLLKVPTIATLLPLYAGTISKERAKQLVKMLENDQLFGPPYPVPSVPVSSAWFHPLRYWQGPTWINMNWLIIDGLKRYGFEDYAEALAESTLELVAKSGMHEYFSPLNGDPGGTDNFSWTAALTIDLLSPHHRA
ncbi:MAG TPA: trehalase family glycosidase [Candidatus Saccharimonadales bacterium]|nr:trehalase family glycosidase [Candidatus Saccharimonadales bacterium]